MSGPSGKLKSKIVSAKNLRPDKLDDMWAVFSQYYDDIERGRFESDLSKKSHVILLRDSGSGCFRDFHPRTDSRKILGKRRAIYSGDTVVTEAYWGQTALQRAFTGYTLKHMVKNPTIPVYWFLISKGYKTYLLLSRNYVEHWPRWEQETPPFQSAVIDTLAHTKFGQSWKRDLGVLKFDEPQGKLKEEVAPIDQELLRQYRDIQFFTEANPGHQAGDELCCLGRVNPAFIANFAMRTSRKLLGRRPKSTVWKESEPK